ncbi:sigma-70 family RNA polymerase sigma factor [Streptomyces sp. IB201691-2A2]|uniref:sigma-70 family RNA polymerase sigma factor n=1 Tax=Streptomyces sp. IB201691-2A2 TaxID=2561920 RepID=UPI0021B121C5|nr:sigma-70 family RNA polymerase sigma factor [Streptomyces sp. IB201691-2A2]
MDDLVEQHRAALLAYARKLLTDHHLAEDIVQETFIRAWRNADRLHHQDGSVRGWLLTVTRNLIIDRARSAPARREALTGYSPDAELPDHTDSVLDFLEVISLLRRLSNEHQEVLTLVYLSGHTMDEISHILDVPSGTVKSRHHYAIRRLRKYRPRHSLVSDSGNHRQSQKISTSRELKTNS